MGEKEVDGKLFKTGFVTYGNIPYLRLFLPPINNNSFSAKKKMNYNASVLAYVLIYLVVQ